MTRVLGSCGSAGIMSDPVGSYRNSLQLRLVQQVVEFVLGGFDLLRVCCVHHVATTHKETMKTSNKTKKVHLNTFIYQNGHQRRNQ